ncbi:MAG: hypothetical protein JSS82_15555 [Bacteroidetes bacterium]|nr:hypothetical protein [Bacteroidota bacterium]
MRQLKSFPQQPKTKPSKTDADRQAFVLKELVESKFWDAIKREIADLISDYDQPIPSKDPLALIGYFSSSIIKDVLSQFVAQIESKAESAPSFEPIE